MTKEEHDKIEFQLQRITGLFEMIYVGRILMTVETRRDFWDAVAEIRKILATKELPKV